MNKRLPFRIVSMLLAVFALIPLTGTYFLIQRGGSPEDAPDPYAYEATDAEISAETQQLAAMVEGAQAKIYELTVPDVELGLARAEVIEMPNGRDLIVGWKSLVTEPVLRSDIKSS